MRSAQCILKFDRRPLVVRFCVRSSGLQSTSLILYRHPAGHQKSVLIREVSLYPKSHYMYYSWMGLCSGHGNAVDIRELSLYPQSLSAKLTVHHKYAVQVTRVVKVFYLELHTVWSLDSGYGEGVAVDSNSMACLEAWLGMEAEYFVSSTISSPH